MARELEFFFDVGSPTTYLAWTRMPDLVARTGASLRLRPLLLGAVFKATGNQSPIMIPAKGRYMMQDMKRFAERYRVPLRLNPFFPFNTLPLMRGAVAWEDQPDHDHYLQTIFRAIWEQERNLSDPDTLREVLTQAGLDPDLFQQRIADEAVKEQLKQNTEEAVRRGVFGAPTFFVGDEMFFGQDRLDFVIEALERQPQ